MTHFSSWLPTSLNLHLLSSLAILNHSFSFDYSPLDEILKLISASDELSPFNFSLSGLNVLFFEVESSVADILFCECSPAVVSKLTFEMSKDLKIVFVVFCFSMDYLKFEGLRRLHTKTTLYGRKFVKTYF